MRGVGKEVTAATTRTYERYSVSTVCLLYNIITTFLLFTSICTDTLTYMYKHVQTLTTLERRTEAAYSAHTHTHPQPLLSS